MCLVESSFCEVWFLDGGKRAGTILCAIKGFIACVHKMHLSISSHWWKGNQNNYLRISLCTGIHNTSEFFQKIFYNDWVTKWRLEAETKSFVWTEDIEDLCMQYKDAFPVYINCIWKT